MRKKSFPVKLFHYSLDTKDGSSAVLVDSRIYLSGDPVSCIGSLPSKYTPR